ncbi:MAG: ABC transporter ATP-binding protein [Gammaproteobacteria bacterium]|nr:ABC transporter ATP-binding protein [Gammaproteobacteria bacterium]
MRTADFAIATRGLTRNFGSLRAVDSLDLKVKAGSLYGFLGRNGAGKSTTIKMLTSILEPSRGKMFLLGTDLSDAAAALAVRRRTGVAPEDMALFELLTGREYLTFVGRMYLLSEDILAQRIEELLSVLELGAGHSQLVLEYSHGMRKKLALAAALLPDPDILFLDEPFEGVDAVASRIMRDILRSHVARGSTVFVTSHVLDVVERLCTDVESGHGRQKAIRWTPSITSKRVSLLNTASAFRRARAATQASFAGIGLPIRLN